MRQSLKISKLFDRRRDSEGDFWNGESSFRRALPNSNHDPPTTCNAPPKKPDSKNQNSPSARRFVERRSEPPFQNSTLAPATGCQRFPFMRFVNTVVNSSSGPWRP
jgi:hypothetical protein